MIAIGCLLLVVLPLLGVALGGYLAGPVGARWGGLAGLGIALLLSGLSGFALYKGTRR